MSEVTRREVLAAAIASPSLASLSPGSKLPDYSNLPVLLHKDFGDCDATVLGPVPPLIPHWPRCAKLFVCRVHYRHHALPSGERLLSSVHEQEIADKMISDWIGLRQFARRLKALWIRADSLGLGDSLATKWPLEMQEELVALMSYEGLSPDHPLGHLATITMWQPDPPEPA